LTVNPLAGRQMASYSLLRRGCEPALPLLRRRYPLRSGGA
jgi:hypothetical protein